MMTKSSGAHILVFPYPAQGHMIPLLDLVSHLASRGLTITIIVTPKNLPLLDSVLSLHPSSISPLTFPFPDYPLLPSGIENQANLPAGGNYTPYMIHALEGLYDPIFQWWTNQDSPPVSILYDMFLGWAHRLATRLGVPGLVFSPSGAMTLSVLCNVWRSLPEKPEDDNALISFPRVPDNPKFPWWQISPLYRSYRAGEAVSESVREVFLGDLASWGIVVNTFTELEGVYLDYLKKDLGHDRIWAVGPLLPMEADVSGSGKRGGSSAESVFDLLKWLDRCDDSSVVYVCFGSQVTLANKQMHELAIGLEKSRENFIWSTKEPTNKQAAEQYGVVPPGFEDRTSERGRVVRGWVPQVPILNHRAVGVFLTHCGWNSMLESIAAGVPMLAWPMTADQFTDATLLVEKLGVAVRVCEGSGTVPDSDELARLFSESLAEGLAERTRERAVKLREAALKAIKNGGSSDKDLDELVKSFLSLTTR